MDYLAGLLELIAKWTVGNKNKWGFIIHLASGLTWSYVALTTKVYGLLVVAVPLSVINIRNFIKWHKEK